MTTAPDGFEEEAPDAGLAAERTDLAWNRSGLALLACGVFVARGIALSDFPPARSAIGACILVLGTLVWLLGGVQAHRRARGDHARERATVADLAPVAIGTAAVGMAAFVISAFFPG